ncbi:MAG: isoprenyl transferase [Gammaproteobacteria bacterium]|nr:isoprenyl transferase [Gammaproteobacteria bacterium]
MSDTQNNKVTPIGTTKMPKHIAIIMDGNGRWAKSRSLPRFAGHRVGLEAVRKTVQACTEYGIEVLTLFAFSSENWQRPTKEVSVLMDLFLTALKKEVKKLHKNNVQLHIIGGLEAFSDKIQARAKESEDLTAGNTGLKLVIAANYGGRWDITNATKKLAAKVKAGELEPEDINEQMLGQYMSLSNMPTPDLFIRTGGEQRISNFLLWDLAYTELYFTELLWPDFSKGELDKAIASFTRRQRRFGLTGDQIEKVAGA